MRRRLAACELHAGDRIGPRRVLAVDVCGDVVTVALADRAPRGKQPQITVTRYGARHPLTVARSGA